MTKFLTGVAAIAAAMRVVRAGISSAHKSAAVMLLHGIPGATVDVAVDGAVVVPNFKPGPQSRTTPGSSPACLRTGSNPVQ